MPYFTEFLQLGDDVENGLFYGLSIGESER